VAPSQILQILRDICRVKMFLNVVLDTIHAIVYSSDGVDIIDIVSVVTPNARILRFYGPKINKHAMGLYQYHGYGMSMTEIRYSYQTCMSL
jgi:hypothetical protein